MEILKKVDIITEREGGFGGRDPEVPGMYETWLLDPEKLDALLGLKEDEAAVCELSELSEKADSAGGPTYGINKVCVAGCLPLKAKVKGKRKVVIIHTGVFDEKNYATEVSLDERRSQTAYEQPSRFQVARVQKWLIENGYAEEFETPEQVEEVDEPVNEFVED